MATRWLRRIMVWSVLIGMLLLAVPAFAQTASASVNTGRLNIRGGPGVSYWIITSVPRGTVLPVIGRNAAATWVQVTHSGSTGWVNVSYVILNVGVAYLPITDSGSVPPPAQTATGTVTGAQYLNVRSSPSASATIVAQLAYGNVVTLVGRNAAATWAQVRLANNITGWVNASYLTTTVTVASLPQTDGTGGPITNPPPTGARIHVVQPGENLYRISLRYGVNMWTIAAANNILNLNQIYAGQQLVIP